MTENSNRYFFIDQLFENCKIPCYVYRADHTLLHMASAKQYTNVLECDSELLCKLTDMADRTVQPVFFLEVISVFWGVMKNAAGDYYIWGPAALMNVDILITPYRHLHGIKDPNYFMKLRSLERLANIMAMAYYVECGSMIEPEEIMTSWEGKNTTVVDDSQKREVEEYQLEKSESDRVSTSVQYEERFVKIVEEGNVSAMKQLMQVNAMDLDGLGQVADKATKKMEYLCVSGVVLVSRAAIRGGMNASAAYDLSDVYMKKLEKCSTVEEMGYVCAKMQIDFTEQVHAVKEAGRGNLFVEMVKDYVAAHLRKPFQIQEMAEDLHVNRTYLAKIFKEQEDITIHQYIMQERCEHAANMLRFTDYSLSIIAEYFCFATQSHFGQKFKEVYGMSPNEYRRKHYLVEGFGRKS